MTEPSKILLVDDEPEILEIFHGLLKDEGYAVRVAQNGEEAIALFKESGADVVVTDIRMPGMSGLEVLRTIKKLDDKVEVIVLTGHASIEVAISALKNDGAFDFLTKPLDRLDDLLIPIEKAIANQRLVRENAGLLEELSRRQIHLEKYNKVLRHTKRELELSRYRYEDLYDQAPVGYLSLDAKGRIVDVNRTAATMLGYQKSQIRDKLLVDFIAQDENADDYFDRDELMDHIPRSSEVQMIRSNGEAFYAHLESLAILKADGTIDQVRMAINDVTEQKQVELALKESEERYRTLVETIPYGIQEIDVNGRITYANPGHTVIHGYGREELVGMSVGELSSTARQGDALLRSLKKYAEEQPLPSTWIGQDATQDGAVKDIQVDWNYKRDTAGRVVGFVSVLSDITERIMAEKALKDSEQRYRSFVENFKGIAFCLDEDGAPVFYHGAVEETTGYSETDLVNSRPGWEVLIHPEELELVKSRRQILSAAADRGIAHEYRIRHRDRRWRWVREHIQCLPKKDHEKSILHGVVFDITEHKQLQAQYIEGRKLDAIATMAAGIAHQFNNSLAGLMGNLELLTMDMDQDPNITNHTDPMMDMVHNMAQLTKQLLAYARGGKYMPASISAHELVHQSVNLMKHRLSEKFELELNLSAERDQVVADSTQMQMVLMAVIENAVEAMADGGRVVVQSTVEELARETVKSGCSHPPGSYLCLSVSDDGCGMTQEVADKIFDPFFTTKFIGRGLGLSAAFGVIVNHNGWMEVDTHVDQGTQMQICLPLATAQQPPSEIMEPGQIIKGDATVLVIEDEEMVVKAVRQLLDRLEYRVLEARTGHEALEILRTFSGQIDVVLLDVRLPDLDALDLYEKILNIRPELKVIVCSGYDKDGPVEKLLASGASAFLQKPFTVARLSAEIRAALEANGRDKNGRKPNLRVI